MPAKLFRKRDLKGDKTLGEALFAFCGDQFKSLPNYGEVLCPYIQQLPVIQGVFFPGAPSRDCVTLADVDYTKELEALGCTIVAAICSRNGNHRFSNVHCEGGVAAFLDGKSWTDPDVKPSAKRFFIDLLIQSTWDKMQNDPFLKSFSRERWASQIHSLVFNEKGESRWIIPAVMVHKNDLLPMQMMIALVRFFGNEKDWENIQKAVQSNWSAAGIADELLAVAGRTSDLMLAPATFDLLVGGVQRVAGAAIDGCCEVDTVLADTNWQTHHKIINGDYCPENDTRDIDHEYGQAVKAWLDHQKDKTLQHSAVDEPWTNTWHESLERPPPRLGLLRARHKGLVRRWRCACREAHRGHQARRPGRDRAGGLRHGQQREGRAAAGEEDDDQLRVR